MANKDRFNTPMARMAMTPLSKVKAQTPELETKKDPMLDIDTPVEQTSQTTPVDKQQPSKQSTESLDSFNIPEKLEIKVTLFPASEFGSWRNGDAVDINALMESLNKYFEGNKTLKGTFGPVPDISRNIYLLAKETGNPAVIEYVKSFTNTPDDKVMFEITGVSMQREGIVGMVTPSGPLKEVLINFVDMDVAIRGYPRYIYNFDMELKVATFDIGPEGLLP